MGRTPGGKTRLGVPGRAAPAEKLLLKLLGLLKEGFVEKYEYWRYGREGGNFGEAGVTRVI